MKQKFIEHEMIQPSPAGHSSILLKHGDSNHSHNAQIAVFGGNDSIKFIFVIFIQKLVGEN